MMLANFSPEVRKALESVSADQIQAEQYLDFVRNRTFRETLLVRDEANPNWVIQPDCLRRLHVTMPYRLTDPARDVRDTTTVQYQTPSGLTVSTSSPTLKAAVRVLLERWPATIPFPELDRAVAETLRMKSDDGKTLALGLLQTYLASDLLELHAAPIPYAPPGPKPAALIEARARLAIGELGAATRRHDYFQASEFERQLLPLLDGTRDRPAILDELVRLTLADDLSVQREGRRLTEPDEIRTALTQALEQTLESLARVGMLKT
jgi:methyltransferase-like protein